HYPAFSTERQRQILSSRWKAGIHQFRRSGLSSNVKASLTLATSCRGTMGPGLRRGGRENMPRGISSHAQKAGVQCNRPLMAPYSRFRGMTSVRRSSGVERRHLVLRKQLLPCLRVLNEDRADGAVLGRLQDLLNGVSRGINGLRLTVVVEPEDLRRDGLAHRIADAHVVV